ncbi:hypothetical protein THF1D04_10758 [Vibrio owensii]|uniref:Uncharacterized protein n=1 Tax=Vibrio owensii TaxID=696485 RepID=A0AAU9PZS2_9VIBR|nr:hypothetical protein THF1D04_10758 [Vibrio owensii]
MENDDQLKKQVVQFKNIMGVAEKSTLEAEERSILIDAICDYFPSTVVDQAMTEWAQKSRS